MKTRLSEYCPAVTKTSSASRNGEVELLVQEKGCFADCAVQVIVKRGWRTEQIAWRSDCVINFAHADWAGNIVAVFVDGGYAAAAALIERLWEERMRTPARPLRDAKTILQEWAQARGLPTPAYREIERKGPHHDPEFRVTVELPNRVPAEGLGRSKRAAEQAAAAAMLTREGVKGERLDG